MFNKIFAYLADKTQKKLCLVIIDCLYKRVYEELVKQFILYLEF